MSRFSRAFDGALREANISRAEAAGIAGYHPSLVSRVLSGESTLTTEHVEKLLLAVKNAADREHCLREFLVDCCPESDRESLIVSFGQLREPPSRDKDQLTSDIERLDRLATEIPDLRKLIGLIISILGKTRAPGAVVHGGKSGGEKRALSGLLNEAGSKPTPTPRTGKRAATGSTGAKSS